MSGTRLTALTALTDVTVDDLLHIVDAPSGLNTDKKITASNLRKFMGSVFNVMDYGVTGDGVTDDTAAIQSAWTALVSAGGGELHFPQGDYLTTGLVFQSGSNFAITADRDANIWIKGSTNAAPYQGTHNVVTIADCTDFLIDGLTVDGRRDTINPNVLLSSSAVSGQPNVVVSDASTFAIGEMVSVYGGMTISGGAEKNRNDSFMHIQGISGNTITLTSNLTQNYTAGAGGAYVTRYQTGDSSHYTAAGRGLGNEDAQNGIHLLTCTRFQIVNCVVQNVWESPVKCGTGFQTTSTTDGCSAGIISGNTCLHGYDQGVSVWNCSAVTVQGNYCEDAGWAGVSLTHCDDCSAIGNICINNVYTPASDPNQGTGVACEGGVRCVLANNICTGNRSNGIRLNNSPMFGNLDLDGRVSGTLTAGATTITMTATSSNYQVGASFTLVDDTNRMIHETIYVTGVSSTTLTISPALRKTYSASAHVYARWNDDVIIIGNTCSQQALGAGIWTFRAFGLKLFANECSRNGLVSGAFVDNSGTYGIHVYRECYEAVVEANTCSFNSKEGIFVDSQTRGAQIVANLCSHNGIIGTNTTHGIKLHGVTDSTVSNNECNYNNGTGILTENGDSATYHLTISGNTCMYNGQSGIWLDNGGTTCTITDNKIAYNADTGIKNTGYSNSVFANNQCYNQNGQEGIRFDDNGSNFCTKNIVIGNLLYDDRGGSASQSYGLRELGSTATTQIAYNRVYGNTSGQISASGTSTSTGNIIS